MFYFDKHKDLIFVNMVALSWNAQNSVHKHRFINVIHFDIVFSKHICRITKS